MVLAMPEINATEGKTNGEREGGGVRYEILFGDNFQAGKGGREKSQDKSCDGMSRLQRPFPESRWYRVV